MSPGARDDIPSTGECYSLITRHRMLPNIIAHSEQVMRVALTITDNLRLDAVVDRSLVTAAALLHDITKTRSLETHERHDETGAALLRELGYPRVAWIVEQHVIFTGFLPDGPVEEREVVYYADKRVMHERIVPLEERVHDLVARYGKTPEIMDLINSNRDFVISLERKLERAMRIPLEKAISALPVVPPAPVPEDTP
jgi:uncharacterized protein